ncbi:MAG TPA: methyl-accepting chemotaxis protein, partial [Opitutales bacterium]|nr:methyl-accepting chemotaxis protein [Opitutales bacterium]
DFTHVVSLNAALQAQKAGPEAQGFAAVAGEVRRLADQSTVATQDIVTMVEELQIAVARTLGDAQQNSGLCTHGVT